MAQFQGWRRVADGCYSADLGGLEMLHVYTDPVAGPWMAEAFGGTRQGFATLADAQAAVERTAREQVELALRRLEDLEPPC